MMLSKRASCMSNLHGLLKHGLARVFSKTACERLPEIFVYILRAVSNEWDCMDAKLHA